MKGDLYLGAKSASREITYRENIIKVRKDSKNENYV